MSFQDRFKGRISVIGKRGIKHTLFQEKQTHAQAVTPREISCNHHQNESLSPSPEVFVPLRKQQTYTDLLRNQQKQLLSTHASSRQSYSVNYHHFGGKSPHSFLDDMLQKHKNLLELIDRRASYRV